MLLMLPVPTLLVVSPIPVTWDTLEMALSVWVSIHMKISYHRLAPLVIIIIDIHECTTGMSNCAIDATCTDTPAGSFTCACNLGYAGDGTVCIGK